MQRRRAGVGVPEQLGVVVGVQVDEAGRDEEAAGVDDRVGAGRAPCRCRLRWRRTRSPSMRTSARTGGAPVPSTTVPPRIAVVMIRLLALRPARPVPVAAPGPAGGRRPACPRRRAPPRSPTASTRPSGRTCRVTEMPWVFTKTVPATRREATLGGERRRRCSTPRRTARSRCRSPPPTASSMSS